MSQSARSEVESGEHREDSGPIATANEPAPERGLQSGAFTKGGAPDWSALRRQPPPPPAAALKIRSAVANTQNAFDTLQGESERAEIYFSNLRLELENPFFGSSLVPPPKPKRPWLKPLIITVAGCALLGAGYVGATIRQLQTPQPKAQVLQAPRAAAQPTAAAIEAAAPPHATPTQIAPVAVAATETATQIAKPAVETKSADRAKPTSPRERARAARLEKRSALAKTRAALPVAPPPAPEHAAAPTASAALENLTRAQVQAGLEGARGALTTCAAGGHGTMMASVTITGSGRITHATIEGAFAGTPQGSCMARALRTAQFPATTTPALKVRYPFVF